MTSLLQSDCKKDATCDRFKRAKSTDDIREESKTDVTQKQGGSAPVRMELMRVSLDVPRQVDQPIVKSLRFSPNVKYSDFQMSVVPRLGNHLNLLMFSYISNIPQEVRSRSPDDTRSRYLNSLHHSQSLWVISFKC